MTRTFTYAAVVAALLVSIGCQDTIETTDDPIVDTTLKDPELSWSSASAEVKIGADNEFPELNNPHSVAVSFSSADTGIATVDSDGLVTLVGGGSTVITATFQANDKYESASSSYTLTVLKADGAISWSAESASTVIGQEWTQPVFNNPNGLTVSFSSSDESVAMVDESGVVTPLAGGVTTIIASSEETERYDAASAAFTLTVTKAEASLSWSFEECTLTMGGGTEGLPELSNPDNLAVSYNSSDEAVASISADGLITLAGPGVTTITASSEESATHSAASASFTLTVVRASSVLTWSESSCTVTLGADDNVFPTLDNPAGLEVKYSSSNTGVATIDEDGSITPVGAGSATISASAAQTNTYEAAEAFFVLNVLSKELKNADLSWSRDNCNATIGASDNSFPTLNNPNALEVSFSSSDESVATIGSDGKPVLVGAGSTIITASSEANEDFAAGSASYTLKVSRVAASLSWSASSCNATMGAADNSFPTLNNPGGLTVSYSSSNTSVATIDAAGVPVLVGAGQTTIIANSPATSTHDAASASYTLTVSRAAAGLSWSAGSCTVTMTADDHVFPTLNNPNGLAVTYSSSAASVATIDSFGNVTAVGAGTATITARSEATSVFEAASVSFTLTVNRGQATLYWSEGSCTAVLDGDNSFPYLVNPDQISVSFSSSDVSVATVSSDGIPVLVGAGTATITASSPATSVYNAASASYVLTVTAVADDGAGTYTFSSTGDASSADDISNTTFTRKITVNFSSSGSATVKGDYYGYATVSGNGVTVRNTGDECIVYELSGTTSNGFFKLYSERKQAIVLNGVSITNKGGAAINNQSGKRTFVVISGTNTLKDGSYSSSSTEDEKAAFFSEGQLVFSGSGSLNVTATGKSGITSDDYVRVMNSPTITVSSSAGHALRGKDFIRIDNGTITASASANMKKGFSSDSLVVFNGGTTTIKVTGGTAYDSEEKDYTSSAGVKADKLFIMNDGKLTITNSGSGGKGINVGTADVSNDCKAYFKGGTVDITCTGSYYTNGDGSAAKGIKVGRKFEKSSTSNAPGWPGGPGGPGGHDDPNSYDYTGDLYISGGKITVRCTGSSSSHDSGNEAIESKGVIEVSGGEVFAYSTTDDAINSADDFTITGGFVGGLSTANDGLDSNGNFYIKGGVVYATGARSPEVGIDANSEAQKKLYVTGGVLFVQGGLESGSSLTQSCYSTSNFSTSTWYVLTVGSTKYAFKTSSAAGTPLVVSGSSKPTLTSGATISGGTTIFDGYAKTGITSSGGSSVSLSNYNR